MATSIQSLLLFLLELLVLQWQIHISRVCVGFNLLVSGTLTIPVLM